MLEFNDVEDTGGFYWILKALKFKKLTVFFKSQNKNRSKKHPNSKKKNY